MSVSLFVISPDQQFPMLSMSTGVTKPIQVKRYLLEDFDGLMPGSHVHEFDAVLEEVPHDLLGYLSGCLSESISAGARVSWLGFEGSFGFAELLADEISPQIYGVADRNSLSVELTSEGLRSSEWLAQVRAKRARLIVDN